MQETWIKQLYLKKLRIFSNLNILLFLVNNSKPKRRVYKAVLFMYPHPCINTDHMNSRFLHTVSFKPNKKHKPKSMNPMFYFLLALTAILATTANAGRPVLDIEGDIIFGGSYYVIPVFFGADGGGLTLSPLGNKQCPLYIGQEPSEANMGIPVRFSNWKSRVGFVPESENLNIAMDVKATICVQSTYWWVAVSGMPTVKSLIAAGPKPEPAKDSSKSFFQIKKDGDSSNGYNIVFCPNDKDCIDVGIFVDKDGVRRLALSSTPFPVMFLNSTDETETSFKKTMSII